MEDAKTILKRWSGMASERAPWDSVWQTVADFGMPRKGNITGMQEGPGMNPANRLYDTTVIDCSYFPKRGGSRLRMIRARWSSLSGR